MNEYGRKTGSYLLNTALYTKFRDSDYKESDIIVKFLKVHYKEYMEKFSEFSMTETVNACPSIL